MKLFSLLKITRNPKPEPEPNGDRAGDRRFWLKVAISAAVIAAAFAAVFAVAIIFSGRIRERAEDIALVRARISRNLGAIENLARLKKEAPKAREYAGELRTRLPGRDRLLEFPRWLEGLAKDSGVSLIFAFTGTTEPGSQGTGFVSFSLNASGDYEKTIKFLGSVEINPARYLVSFDTFDINRRGADYVALIEGRVFFGGRRGETSRNGARGAVAATFRLPVQ